MKLFRRLLQSLFPSDIQSNGMNPVGMFVGFISPKQFFSVVHRRLVENYKLNLFDIGLEPFEVKIGFGDKPNLKVKDLDFYYAYGSVSNLNGWGFYSPGNLATTMSIVVSVLTKDILKKYDAGYVVTFFVSIYLLTFIFVGKLRVFPKGEKQKQYQRFVETFFNFYEMVVKKHDKNLDLNVVKDIKTDLLQHIQIFFMLFSFYARMNQLFDSPGISLKDFYQWLFYDELKSGKSKERLHKFVLNSEHESSQSTFALDDEEIIKLVLPADVHIRYLYQGDDRYVIADKLLAHVYEGVDLEGSALRFLKDDSHLEEFLTEILDHSRFKNRYFSGCKLVTSHKFSFKQSYTVSKEIDSFMSTIEESGGIDGVKIPNQLKQEGALMDRLIKFYVTFIGGLWVGRGDTFYLRLLRKPLVNKLLETLQQFTMKHDSLYYYGGLLYSYTKNVFYYKYAFENVRAGNETFSLPLKASFKEVYSNMYILKLFDEYFLNTVLQDINKKTLKLSVSNEAIVDEFKHLLGKDISLVAGLGKEDLLESMYRPVCNHIQSGDQCMKILKEMITDNDITHLKDNLYTIDIRMRRESMIYLYNLKSNFPEVYGDMSILGISSMMRETIFGFVLYMTMMIRNHNELDETFHIESLKQIYCVDVLNVSQDYYPYFSSCIEHLYQHYKGVLDLWIHLDDNEGYMEIMLQNWKTYISGKSSEQITHHVTGEDTVRFRGFLKTITYYNKRYLMPQ